jgi:hypothetical protein
MFSPAILYAHVQLCAHVLTALYNVQKLLFLTVETDRKRTILVRYTDMASRGVIDPVISCGSNANVVPHHYKVTMVT